MFRFPDTLFNVPHSFPISPINECLILVIIFQKLAPHLWYLQPITRINCHKKHVRFGNLEKPSNFVTH